MNDLNRREFLKAGMTAAASLGIAVPAAGVPLDQKRNFKISVAGWSLHREVSGGKWKQLDLFRLVREELDIDAFELVNTMLEVPTASYVTRLKQDAERHGVRILLIMVDREGDLGHADPDERKKAVRNHAKWVYIASDLGCHSVRVNWGGHERGAEKDPALGRAFIERSLDAFRSLIELGRAHGVNILIENHGGGPSANPRQLIELMQAVNSPFFGTLPDFGNFPDEVDRYDAVDRMMPFAKAVSAKCNDFDERGNETRIDFERMLRIVIDKHGYNGYLGIEYEGNRLSELEGIRACRDLLLRLRDGRA